MTHKEYLEKYINQCKGEVKANVEHQEILKIEHNLLLTKMYEAEYILDSYIQDFGTETKQTNITNLLQTGENISIYKEDKTNNYILIATYKDSQVRDSVNNNDIATGGENLFLKKCENLLNELRFISEVK